MTLAAARPSTSSSARNASCWLAYWPPISTRIPLGAGFLHRHLHLGARLGDAVVQILDAVDLLDLRRELLRVRLERVEVGTEESNLDRPRRPREIVDDVRQNLHELDVEARHGGADLVAHIGDHLEDGTAALARRLETRDNVTSVLLRGKQSE